MYLVLCVIMIEDNCLGGNMIYKLNDTRKVEKLLCCFDDTLVTSCLEKVMGDIFVTDLADPVSCQAVNGCFIFFAGQPDPELVRNRLDGFCILVPEDDRWMKLIEDVYGDRVEKATRYAIKKCEGFDRAKLQSYVNALPKGFEIKKIDSDIYDMCLNDSFFEDFVSAFESKEKYLQIGLGFVVMKDQKIVSGASSYTSYLEGIEIEVDTHKDYRKLGLARAVCARLILECLDRGLYPSWDAQNTISVHLSETLGYEFSHEYTVYELE